MGGGGEGPEEREEGSGGGEGRKMWEIREGEKKRTICARFAAAIKM